MQLQDLIRFSWMVHGKSIAATQYDASLYAHVQNQNSFRFATAAISPVKEKGIEAAWMKLISIPVIAQMHTTQTKAGTNSLAALPKQVQQSIVEKLHLDRHLVSFVFVAPNEQIGEVYTSRLAMTYAYTTQKIPIIRPLHYLVDTLFGFDVEAKDELVKVGMLIVCDCLGSIAKMDKIEGNLNSLLQQRARNGRLTVFVIDTMGQTSARMMSDISKWDITMYQNTIEHETSFQNCRPLMRTLSVANSYVCSYGQQSEDEYVGRILLPSNAVRY